MLRQVDIVYLAMLHTGHCRAALLMINAGKHVLVEKPFAMNEKEARRMVDAARNKVRTLQRSFAVPTPVPRIPQQDSHVT